MYKKKYQYIQIGIASPEEIISWANPLLREEVAKGNILHYNPLRKEKMIICDSNDNFLKEVDIKGEVKKHETINYRTFKPEKDGLFCEVIFGPTKDYQCACGKSKRSADGKVKVCEKCGVELTESKVRRERMGYIALAAPVVHNWYLKSVPSKIGTLLDMKTTQVDDVVYLASYIVIEVDDDVEDLYEGMIITEQENAKYKRLYPFKYKVKTGAEAIRFLLQRLNIDDTIREIHEELHNATKQRREKLIKRLEICEAFAHSHNKPEWMVMDVIPVIPPDLRPMVPLDGGRFATTDLNDLYRRIITRNNRLRRQYEVNAPELITKNEKRMLQEACDALIDNTGLNRRNKRAVMDKNRALKSLSDLLRGKQGRFRQNLLGKRVDYSGRSVIVVGPDLKMYQCGIPREMALILFKPFIINYLRTKDLATGDALKEKAGIKKAKDLIERGAPEAMEALEKIVVEHPVLLNRAPTLHRLSIQAFEPKLVEGKAIRLHPLVCTAFNADFDGDQMPVHLPLSKEAQTEARMLMLASKNILAPKDGKPIVTPSQDMILGNYYLTIERKPHNVNNCFASIDEFMASPFVAGFPSIAHYLATTPHARDPFKVVLPNGEERIYDSNKGMRSDDEYHTSYLQYDGLDGLKEDLLNGDCPADAKVFFLDQPQILLETENGSQIFDSVDELKVALHQGKVSSVAKVYVLNEGRLFRDPNEVEHAYEEGQIQFSTRIALPAKTLDKNLIHIKEELKDENPALYQELLDKNEALKNKFIITTYGKIIFNSIFPHEFAYVNESEVKNLTDGMDERFFVSHANEARLAACKLPLCPPVKKKFLSAIIYEVFKQAKLAETSNTLDKMKDLGFYYSTRSGITVSAFDVMEIDKKGAIIRDAEKRVEQYEKMYRHGLLTPAERYKNIVQVWSKATTDIEAEIKVVMKEKATENDIFLMADSGARGSSSNFTQLAGMRGLMNKPNGEAMEIPVKSCFREGMSMSEFFISTHGARKGSTDTALKTAESGYLTRRLVDVSHDVTVTMDDCGTDKGMVMKTMYNDNGSVIVHLKERILGRFASKRVEWKNPKTRSKEVLCERNQRITEEIADRIVEAGITEVEVRTLFTCDCKNGVCVKCYGSDLSTTETVEKGEVVGIVAAQSIGEPGTQLTMRTFHSGGVAGGEDITRGLPRIQELFEAREPKGKGIISEIDGRIEEVRPEKDNRFTIIVRSDIDRKVYLTDAGKKPIVKVGDLVRAGHLIVEGTIHPKELLRVANVAKVEKYIVTEVQKVYRSQGVDISDKHIEIIVKQMLQKAIVIHEGDTDLLPGTFISHPELYEVIKDALAKGKRLPVVKPVILGITRASLKADSFLSAASFQETTRVLTEAAIRGKIDRLEGLKENIIIGGLIPAGTGLVDEVEIEPSDPDEQQFDVPVA